MRSRSRCSRSRHVLPRAGAGSLRTFYLEPEPKCFPGTGAGAVKNFRVFASLTRIQLDQLRFLGFPADDRVWIPTWVNAHEFLTTSRSEYRKMLYTGVVEKAIIFPFRKTYINFFLIDYELSPCKAGLNMETLYAGSILTLKCPIVDIRFWLGLDGFRPPDIWRIVSHTGGNVGVRVLA